MATDTIIIYCDGACAGNQQRANRGGWGAVLKYRNRLKKIWGGEANTTNNRMELTACIRALEAIKWKNAPVEVYTDSAYIYNCITQRWYERWQRNGWKTAKKQPVENQDLWKRLLTLLQQHRVTFHKVAGHAGVELNELADALANRGIEDPDGGSEDEIVEDT